LPFDSPWYAANELDRHRAMLSAFAAWYTATRGELTEIGTEVELDGLVTPPADGLPGVRVRGRIDRLERDAQGRTSWPQGSGDGGGGLWPGGPINQAVVKALQYRRRNIMRSPAFTAVGDHPRPLPASPWLPLIGVLAATLIWAPPGQAAMDLDQGWSDEETDIFYHEPQGSELLPYDWFMALERPEGGGHFSSQPSGLGARAGGCLAVRRHRGLPAAARTVVGLHAGQGRCGDAR
jgi:hypothetical protein